MAKTECADKNCPIHGSLRTRGRSFVGRVISSKMSKSVTIEFERRYHVPKYERYEKRRTRLKAHNPECISAVEGDVVKVVECRPLSKTKHFVIIEKQGKTKNESS